MGTVTSSEQTRTEDTIIQQRLLNRHGHSIAWTEYGNFLLTPSATVHMYVFKGNETARLITHHQCTDNNKVSLLQSEWTFPVDDN